MFEVNLQEGTGHVSGFAIPFETNEHGTIRHVGALWFVPIPGIELAIQVAFLPSFVSSMTNETSHKLLLVTSTGSLQLWDRNVLHWVREESLSTIQTATIVELPPLKVEVVGGVGFGDKSESFWSKLARQIADTKVRFYL